METYYRSEQQRKIYKLKKTEAGAELYWVSVYQLKDGSFFHGRGMDVVDTYEKGQLACEMLAVTATSEDYLTALKDYFAIDKRVRESFINQYKL